MANREFWKFSIQVRWQDTGAQQPFQGTVDTPPGTTAASLLDSLLEDISRNHQRRKFSYWGYSATFCGRPSH